MQETELCGVCGDAGLRIRSTQSTNYKLTILWEREVHGVEETAWRGFLLLTQPSQSLTDCLGHPILLWYGIR